MEYLIEYGLFLAKAITIVLAIIILISAITSSGQKHARGGRKGSIRVTRLNEHFEEMRDTLREKVLNKHELKLLAKQEKKADKEAQKEQKARLKQAQKAASSEEVTQPETEADNSASQAADDGADDERKPRVYVLNFQGNVAADAVDNLREEITAVLSMAEIQDRVLVRLESPGGMVHAYGLAASQLLRIRNKKIPLTICVDKVAASGGYMMACLADKLVAAPFSIIGSIGVALEMPNFNRVLKKLDVDYEQITAGEFKRTLSTFGEITDKSRQKAQDDVEVTHTIFKSWVKEHRPSVEIDRIATGEIWLGSQAKERYMVDEINTSDDCIVAACGDADVYEVEYEFRKSFQDKVGGAFGSAFDAVYKKLFHRTDTEIFK